MASTKPKSRRPSKRVRKPRQTNIGKRIVAKGRTVMLEPRRAAQATASKAPDILSVAVTFRRSSDKVGLVDMKDDLSAKTLRDFEPETRQVRRRWMFLSSMGSSFRLEANTR